jgi:arabinofuranosyltransferase
MAPLVLIAVVGWAHRWMFDDGFIYLRVVRQVRVGHGPVFNAGERVEAFTSPLWVAVLSVADLLTPLRLEWIAVGLGIVCSVLGAALAIAGAARLTRLDAPGGFLVPVGIVGFAAVLPVWYFETSGLETGLVFAWLGACTWVLASWARTEDGQLPRLGLVVIGLGWLVRPELVVDSLVFVAVVSILTWRATTWAGRLGAVLWATGLPLAYQIFRMGYYGSTVANTAIAKEGSRLRLDAGWSYLQDFVRPYWLWVPVVVLVAGVYAPLAIRLSRARHTRAASVLAAFVLAAVANAGVVVAFGGDYLHGRLLLPALFAFCAPIAVVPATGRYIASVVALGWAMVCLVALRPPETRGTSVFVFRDGIAYTLPRATGRVTLADEGGGVTKLRELFAGHAVFINLSGYGKQNVDRVAPPYASGVPLPTVVSGAIGALGYALGPDVNILDVNGLGDPLTAHFALFGRGEPGHEKLLPPSWIAARVTAPDAELEGEVFFGERWPTTPTDESMPFPSRVKWARAALQCSAIVDLRRSTHDRLTPGLFLSNILHSSSRTSRRIPSDPHQAALRFCGRSAAPAISAATSASTNRRPASAAVDGRSGRFRSFAVVSPVACRLTYPAQGHHQSADGLSCARAPPRVPELSSLMVQMS